MKTSSTFIDGLLIFEPSVYFDERGYFFESYKKELYQAAGLPEFVQDNESKSNKDVLRGLHYQKAPYEQGKLVRVIEGAVLDVVVDIRVNSPTFGKYFSLELSQDNKKQFWIPAGFAHGFLTLSESAILSYKCTSYYNQSAEGGIIWNDPDIAIDWGIIDPIVSSKDMALPLLNTIEELKVLL